MIAFRNYRYYCIIVLLSYVSVMIIAVLSLCSGNCRELDVGNLACLNMLLRPGATQGRSSGWVTWLDFRSCRQREQLKDFLILLFSTFPLRFGGNCGSFLTFDALIRYTGCKLLVKFSEQSSSNLYSLAPSSLDFLLDFSFYSTQTGD